MITNGCVKELRRLLGLGRTLGDSARMAEMSEKTARKYRDHDGQPSQQSADRTYRTRSDPFADVWDKVQQRLELEPRLKAKTLFEWLQQTYEGLFPDSTRRTFERRMNQWRSLHGPGKAIFFDREHHPGRLAASDFTVCNELAEHYWVRSLSLVSMCGLVSPVHGVTLIVRCRSVLSICQILQSVLHKNIFHPSVKLP